jgi:hypothetical protein
LRNIEHVSMAGARFCQYLVERFRYRMEEWREESHYDMKPAKRVAQRMRDFAYWTFRRGGWRATALRWVPVLNRAMDWPAPPALECTPDHIVVAFRKQGSGT